MIVPEELRASVAKARELGQWMDECYELIRHSASDEDVDVDEYWFQGLEERAKSYQDGVHLDITLTAVRLLHRIASHPGPRVEGLQIDRLLWGWLRKLIINIVGEQTVDPFETDNWTSGDPRQDTAVTLRRLIPLAPPLPSGFADEGPYRSDRKVTADLEDAQDSLIDLTVRLGVVCRPKVAWPKLTHADVLVTRLVAIRNTEVIERYPDIAAYFVSVEMVEAYRNISERSRRPIKTEDNSRQLRASRRLQRPRAPIRSKHHRAPMPPTTDSTGPSLPTRRTTITPSEFQQLFWQQYDEYQSQPGSSGKKPTQHEFSQYLETMGKSMSVRSIAYFLQRHHYQWSPPHPQAIAWKP